MYHAGGDNVARFIFGAVSPADGHLVLCTDVSMRCQSHYPIVASEPMAVKVKINGVLWAIRASDLSDVPCKK